VAACVPQTLLLLPNAACLSAAQMDAIRNFVQNGGGLVASLDTSLCSETGAPSHYFGLSDVLGAHYLGAAGRADTNREAIDKSSRWRCPSSRSTTGSWSNFEGPPAGCGTRDFQISNNQLRLVGGRQTPTALTYWGTMGQACCMVFTGVMRFNTSKPVWIIVAARLTGSTSDRQPYPLGPSLSPYSSNG
jgi:hypothetical protein